MEPGTFPTAKVKGGYDFAGPTYDADDPESAPQPDPDPTGSATATARTSRAPPPASAYPAASARALRRAPPYALKVFGDVAGSTDVTRSPSSGRWTPTATAT